MKGGIFEIKTRAAYWLSTIFVLYFPKYENGPLTPLLLVLGIVVVEADKLVMNLLLRND
ncbi:hypothetical protein [Spirosoma sp. KCTC 42546]|uniref:hypothetical protein n=1 Tax=Spirosoma sp. KCTC 42546 TaxID=2520506 RepID=UPI00143DB00C|nr:hypothetical protein [Spirosoma sp. KCTC 42546]